MSKQFRFTLNYKKVGGALEIYSLNISAFDSIALINNGFAQFLNKLILTNKGDALTDESHDLVYVLHSDFKNKFYIIYLIDGKMFKEETGLPDSYGLTKVKPKVNKELAKNLALIKSDLSNYNAKVYKGLKAYKKFGYKSVFGVIELSRKE